jgi:tetratricopeptide (TPR) repeat protein
MHQKALQLRRRFYGKENLSVAESLDRLAEALRGQGQLAEAEASGREALALRSRLSAASDANIASSQGQLATTLMFERKYQEAEKLHREALAKHRELLGNTNLAVAGSLLGLALVLEGDGHAKDVYPEAERLTREALSIHATINGYDDPNVGHLFDALGTALEGMGKYPDAERAYRDGLVVRRRLLGDMHPDLAWSYLHVGGALKNQGKLAEAEESLRKALAIREKAPSSAHIGVSYAFQGLCDCLQNEGKYAEEERTFREWVEWAEKSGDSAGATNALAGLTGCFQAQKKYAEQERIYREWIELAEKSGDHSGVSSALAGLAGCFQAQEKYADQERTYRELLEWAERSGDHAGMIKALMGLARSLETQGEYSQAEQSLRKCALMARNSGSATEAGIVLNNLAWLLATGPDSTLNDGTNAIGFAEEAAMTTARTNGTYLDTLAAAYARAGQFSNAATIQKEAIGLVKDEQSKKDYSTRLRLYESGHAYRNHAVLAERVAKLLGAGRFDEAEPLARECLIIRAMEMPGHWITCNARVMLGGALSGQKNYAAAEPFLLEGYDGLKHHEAAIPKPRLKEAIEYLMILYKATERTEEVERWKMKLTEWYREEGARRRHAADSGDLRALNDAAWLLATCEDSAARDGSAAIGYAEKAVTATNRKDHSSLDTLAAAYAEGRQFAKAVSAQKEALALVQNESLRQGLASRLKLYESNTPYREH